MPASSSKFAADTNVQPAAVKPEAQKATPLAGENTAATAANVTQKPIPSARVANDTFFSRRNPVVEAVQKTKNAIVTVRVPRPNGAKDMIGTGVIVDQHGFIITNRHVVGDAEKVIVILADETKLSAEVLVAEASYDLAILRIRTKQPLTVLPLATVEDLMVGETVIAVGHPFGYTNTVSTGIISALGREITMPTGDVLSGLIQTNASINPGNSGGPLLNINGEWIGVNVALREGAQNIAFTINAATVKSFLRKHLSAARVSGIQHGLQCGEKVLGETGDRQRVVVAWFQGEGILAKGDEILTVGNRNVTNTFDVERAFWGRKPGEQRSTENRASGPGDERLPDRDGD